MIFTNFSESVKICVLDQRKRAEDSRMDTLIRLFAEKTPIHLLENHKQVMRKFACCVTDDLRKSALATEDCIMSGSMAEGASLARLFSPDSKTSREFEMDFMVPVAEWPTEEGMIYVENNKAFVHIVVDSEVVSLVRSFCGEDGVKKSYCEKEDGTYMSSQLTKANFKEEPFASAFINKFGFRPCNFYRRCEDGSASVAFQMDNVLDKEEEPCADDTSYAVNFPSAMAQLREDAAAAEQRLISEIISCCETFEIKITQMLEYLETIQYEFMEMRKSGEAMASLYKQASKALEWALTCADITDIIYDARQETVCRSTNECMGFTTEVFEESKSREQIKQKLQVYIDQLAISEDDVSNVSVAAAVRELLSNIERTEIAPKRYLFVFREFARLQEKYHKMMAWVDQNPQLHQIAQPLQQLDESIIRTSQDFVPCFKLMFWPSVAAEWKTRSRLWPDHSVIEEIASKCAHLVAKAFCHVDIDWRLVVCILMVQPQAG